MVQRLPTTPRNISLLLLSSGQNGNSWQIRNIPYQTPMMGNFAENGNMNPQAQNGYAMAQP